MEGPRLPSPPLNYDVGWVSRFVKALRDAFAFAQSSREDIVVVGRQLIVRSPNGKYWSVGVDDNGDITTVDLGDSL